MPSSPAPQMAPALTNFTPHAVSVYMVVDEPLDAPHGSVEGDITYDGLTLRVALTIPPSGRVLRARETPGVHLAPIALDGSDQGGSVVYVPVTRPPKREGVYFQDAPQQALGREDIPDNVIVSEYCVPGLKALGVRGIFSPNSGPGSVVRVPRDQPGGGNILGSRAFIRYDGV